MPGLDSEALDFRAASVSFAPVRRIAPRDLEVLRLMTNHQGHKVPTVGGLLLFGVDRERHFPDAWIQAGRFRDNDRSRLYVGAEAQEDDGEPFEEKLKRLVATLREQQTEAARLDAAIAANLKELGYGG
jgi:predicted HTH transcriptional regulator